MMKKIKVQTLSDEILEITGTPKQQRNRIRELSYIYSKPFSEINVKSHFWHEHGEEISVHSRRLNIGDFFFFPKSVSDFVSIALSMNMELYWDEETYTEFIDNRVKAEYR